MNHTTRTISTWLRARRRDHTLRRTLMRVEDLLDVYHRAHLTLEDENTAGTDPTVTITFIAKTRHTIQAGMEQAIAFAAISDNQRLKARYLHIAEALNRIDGRIDDLRRRRNEMALLEYEANGMDGDVLTSIRQTLENSGMFLDRIDTVEIDPDEEGWC